MFSSGQYMQCVFNFFFDTLISRNLLLIIVVSISFRKISFHIHCRRFRKGITRDNHLSVANWTNRYGIHHWTIHRRRYRKLAWLGFEPTTTEFHSDALTDWAIRPWVQLALRANSVQLFQFHLLFSVRFHFGYSLCQLPPLFNQSRVNR